MALLPGWRRLNPRDTSKQMVSPSGTIVSYRSYLNQARANQPAPTVPGLTFTTEQELIRQFGSLEAWERVRNSAQFSRMARDWAFTHGQTIRGARRPGSAFVDAFAQAFPPGVEPDKRAHGPLARLLEGLGWRTPGATYAVGETP